MNLSRNPSVLVVVLGERRRTDTMVYVKPAGRERLRYVIAESTKGIYQGSFLKNVSLCWPTILIASVIRKGLKSATSCLGWISLNRGKRVGNNGRGLSFMEKKGRKASQYNRFCIGERIDSKNGIT